MPRTPNRLNRFSPTTQHSAGQRTANLSVGFLAGLIGLTGCAGNSQLARNSILPDASPLPASVEPSVGEAAVGSALSAGEFQATKSNSLMQASDEFGAVPAPEPADNIRQTSATSVRTVTSTSLLAKTNRDLSEDEIQHVPNFNGTPDTLNQSDVAEATDETDDLSFAQQLISNPLFQDENTNALAVYDGDATEKTLPEQSTQLTVAEDANEVAVAQPVINQNFLDLNLPSALAMVGGSHPVVGMAQWRVKEAYADLAQARVLWLPSISAGFGFHRHDGNYQASNGDIVDVNRNSFQYGLGTGATGAGTTQRPGLVARFHLADALFQPKVSEKTAWARGHGAKAVINQQLLEVAQAYTELVGAHQDVSILNETRQSTADLLKITTDFAEAGQGLQADADRMQTELALIDSRIAQAQERVAVASARMAQAISVDGSRQILPLDVVAIPIDFAATEMDQASLIGTGLATRPELCESQALVAAACEAYRREKYAPFVPSVLLGFSTGGFGGGLGNNLSDVDGRYDFDALMSWEVRNLGFGEKAARQRSAARIQQAKFQKLRVMDEVARQVSEAAGQVRVRRQRVEINQRAITSAEQSYERNLDRIKDGQGLPIEVLQSVQALEQARRGYLQAIVDHNQSQFALQWALGWPIQQP